MFEVDDKPQDIDLGLSPLEEKNATILANKYREVYDAIELCNARVKELNKQRTALETLLYDALVAGQLASIKIQGVGSFGPDLKKKCAIVAKDHEKVFKALEEAGHGDVIKRQVHFQTLNKLYRNGDIDEIASNPELIRTWEEKKIKMRRAAGTLPLGD